MNLIFPNCSSELGIMSKFGVEIDQSPRCKGVWLDIGELKKWQTYRTDTGMNIIENIIMEKKSIIMTTIIILGENIKKEIYCRSI
jgi:Zn-finger nucleic acid-binding protein